MLSRVADSLYWMSRYLERAEHTARLLLAKIDAATEESESQSARSWRRLLGALHYTVVPPEHCVPTALALKLTMQSVHPSSILSAVHRARDNARQVREQISADMWERLNRQYLSLRTVDFDTIWRASPADFFARVIDDLLLFHGVSEATMRHAEGWHFIQLGRVIERTQLLSRLLDVHFGGMPPDVPADLEGCEHLDWFVLLRGCAAFEAYCKVHTTDVKPEAVAEFLILDPLFPRSLRFTVNRIAEELARIGQGAQKDRFVRVTRLAGRLKAKLDFGQLDEVLLGGADSYLDEVQRTCEQIHDAMRETYFDYAIEQEIMGQRA